MPNYINKQFEVVGDLVLSGQSISQVFEPLGELPPIRSLTTTTGTLTGASITIPTPTLALSGALLEIAGGNTIDLTNIIPEIDIQTLTLSGSYLSIDRGNTVDLSSMSQTLSVSGTDLSISDGNTVDLGFFSR